jgi:hypothetical protein
MPRSFNEVFGEGQPKFGLDLPRTVGGDEARGPAGDY